MSYVDPLGLWWPGIHNSQAYSQGVVSGMDPSTAARLGDLTGAVDGVPGSQNRENSSWHAMKDPSWDSSQAEEYWRQYVNDNLAECTLEGLARALHAIQDSFSPAHRGFQTWWGADSYSIVQLIPHGIADSPLSIGALAQSKSATRRTIQQWRARCECKK